MSFFDFLDSGSESFQVLGFAQIGILGNYLLQKLFVGCLSFLCVSCQGQFSQQTLIHNFWLETWSVDVNQFGKCACGVLTALSSETFLSFEIHRVNPLDCL